MLWFFMVLGKSQALHMPGRYSTTKLHPQQVRANRRMIYDRKIWENSRTIRLSRAVEVLISSEISDQAVRIVNDIF